jgi:SH3 domain-containing YSC84-like protein 1
MVIPMKRLITLLVLVCLASLGWADQTKTDVVDRMDSAAKTLQEIEGAPDKGIPGDVLTGAKCVAIVPSLVKGGFVVGGEYGRGVSTCKLPNGHWSAPAFFTISGGSFGLQIGAEGVQLVMMIMNNDGMRHLLQDKFKVGGEASAAAGPVGRDVSASEAWKLNSQILTYSRAKGAFAGLDLSGSVVEKDVDSTKALYAKDYSATALLTGKVPVPPSAHTFLAAVAHAKAEAVASKNNSNKENNR